MSYLTHNGHITESDIAAADRALVVESLVAGRAYDTVADLCELAPHRLAGSPGDPATVEYLTRIMEVMGLANISTESFPFSAWERGATRLQIVGERGRDLDVLALAGSQSVTMEGELADAGYGSEEEFAALGEAVSGRIVLVRNGAPGWMKRYMHRGEKTARAGRYGAIGMVLMNMQMGALTLVGSRGFEEGQQLPAVSISYESGMELVRRLRVEGAVQLRLEMQHKVSKANTFNVIGDLRGRIWPDRYLIVGAHYDSHDIAPGAIDDAAGVAIALEVVRLLSMTQAGVGRSVRVVAFGAEELGLLGSQAYVAAHKADIAQIDFMLNLDCAGGPGSKTLTVHAWPELTGLMRVTTDEIDDLDYVDWISSTHSDHFPFLLAGAPTATLTGERARATMAISCIRRQIRWTR